ncbi:Syntaxin-61 [Histomonas meleagridis]|uniref:Syntaxin-61 n=1 Tax=Histomonas meleagridis TaxID=135588 RepID=UPI00355A91E1|nr:Syntaxin-61 [Histomonas meleagridis]KAH0800537.1 Syntaxin-61 [Histomonas meleagridis]
MLPPDPFNNFLNQLKTNITNIENRVKELQALRQTNSPSIAYLEAQIQNQYSDALQMKETLQRTVDTSRIDPSKHNLTLEQLDERENELKNAQSRLNDIKNLLENNLQHITSPKSAPESNYVKAKREDNQNFIDEELRYQNQQLERQDQDLDTINEGVTQIKQIGNEINNALLDDQERLNDMDEQMERAQNKLDRAVKKLIEIADNPECWFKVGCVVLTCIAVALLIYVFLV